MSKTVVNKKNTSDYSGIAERFRSVRISLSMTQKEFGEELGLSAPSIGAIENGLYTPNFSVIRILKKKFNVEYSYLIDGIITNNPHDDYEEIKAEVIRLRKVVDRLTT